MRHMEPKAMQESIETILHIIGLVNDRQTFSKDLSGGMKRRLSIGISLLGDPKVFHFVPRFLHIKVVISGTHT
jgi:ABC-2 type transport system ATP-binding protein